MGQAVVRWAEGLRPPLGGQLHIQPWLRCTSPLMRVTREAGRLFKTSASREGDEELRSGEKKTEKKGPGSGASSLAKTPPEAAPDKSSKAFEKLRHL